jgi:DNA-binding CsgD family transcriptional regulator
MGPYTRRIMSQVRPLLSPILVGRDDLLELAERRIAEAAAGRGQLLLLAGEAGIGKTRMMGAILRRAGGAGFRISKGDLAPQDRQVPLASILDLARTMRRVPAFGTLGDDLLEIRGGQGGDNLGSRRLLVRDIADRITSTVETPTLLAFEDLQWADEISLEVIGELARLGRDMSLLLVGAYRADELPVDSYHREWRARLLSQRLAEEARLTSLTYEQTALVTTLILGTGLPAPREVVKAVFERTDGIPLHIEELLGALGEDARQDGRAIREAVVPDTIEDAILARASRLSAEARAVARAGAVIGRCFLPEVLAGVLDRPVRDLDGPLEELVASSFLYPFEFLDRGYYDFRHQLLRDALYETVPASELRRLHARAGEFGADLPGASAIHASVHFERAGLRAQAFRAALAGARAAAAMSSRRESFELYGRAADNIPDDLPAIERAELYDGYCEAAFAVDNVAVGLDTARLARRWYLEAGRPVDAAMALVSEAGMARRDVRPAEERKRLLDQAEAELRDLPETPGWASALSELRTMQAVLRLDRVQLDEAALLLAEARELCLASEDPDVGGIDFIAATADVLAGRIESGLGTMLRIAREARDLRLESTGVTAYRSAAALAVRVMDYQTAEIGLREGLRYADEVEQSYCRHVLAATSAHVAWAQGRWDDTIPTAEIELVERGSRRGTLGSRDALGFVAFGRGQVERARELFEASLAIGRTTREVELILPAMWGLAETALVAGEPAAAIGHCDDALRLAVETGERALLVPFVVTGVRAHLAARRPDGAERWLERVRPMFSAWVALATPALDHADGLLRLAAGSTVAARSALEAAIEGWDARPRAWEAAWARLDLAACLLRANRPGEAVSILRDVQALAENLDSPPLRDRALELTSLARSRGAEEEPWRPLTAREFEIARLVSEGLTNGEIADQLGLSPKTVSAHVEHILAKLGASRRSEIAAWVVTIQAGPAIAGAPTTASAMATHAARR